MPFYILSIVLQVAFVVHIVKTGRNTIWIWIVIMLPFAGAMAYLIVELLPELLHSRTGRKAARTVDSAINPHRTLKQAELQYTVTDTVQNTLVLADEFLAKQRYVDAKPLYEKCLKGMYENDPDMLCKLARCEYGLGDYAAVIVLLDRLKQHNPDYRNADAHLLYAMALAAQGKSSEALHEYEALHRYYPGPEATCRYAQLLQTLNRNSEAQALFAEVVSKAKIAGKHYVSLHKAWVDLAKKSAGNGK